MRHGLGPYRSKRRQSVYTGPQTKRTPKDPYKRFLAMQKDNIEAIKEAQDLPLDNSGLSTYPEEI